MAIVITIVNACLFLIWINIKESLVRPQVDEGIRVWWMCCLRIAQSSGYVKAEQKRQAREMKRKAELSMAKGLQKVEANRKRINELKKLAKDSLASDGSETRTLKEVADLTKAKQPNSSVKQRQQNMMEAWMN
mmetsp:Transcript_6576/g.10577  ORF Transcript_6576/g.10577 Transcript_6576/m.10577 type:complete len:133 (-) Transcript_6576:1605-2003(-)